MIFSIKSKYSFKDYRRGIRLVLLYGILLYLSCRDINCEIPTTPIPEDAIRQSVELNSMTLSSGSYIPEYDDRTTSYSTWIAYNQSPMTITLEKKYAYNRIKLRINQGAWRQADSTWQNREKDSLIQFEVFKACSLKVFQNTIEVLVMSQDSSRRRTFNIVVTRGENGDSLLTPKLSRLEVDFGKLVPDFSPDITEYRVTTARWSNSRPIIVATEQRDVDISFRDSLTGKQLGMPNNTEVDPDIQEYQALPDFYTTYTLLASFHGGLKTNPYSIRIASVPGLELDSVVPSWGKINPGLGSLPNGTNSIRGTLTLPFSVSNVNFKIFPRDTSLLLWINGTPIKRGIASSPISPSTGKSTVKLSVAAPNKKDTVEYHLHIQRATAAMSTEAGLVLLKSSVGSINPAWLSNSITDYTLSVFDTTNSVNLTCNAIDTAATVTINGNVIKRNTPFAVTTGTGRTVLPIKCVAADGATERTVRLTIDRPYLFSNELSKVRLVQFYSGSSATVGGARQEVNLPIKFNSKTLEYSFDLPLGEILYRDFTAKPFLQIDCWAVDTSAMIFFGQDSSKGALFASRSLGVEPESLDSFSISVKQSNQTKVYKFRFTRTYSEGINPYLSSLSVSPGAIVPQFSEKVLNYVVNLSKTDLTANITAGGHFWTGCQPGEHCPGQKSQIKINGQSPHLNNPVACQINSDTQDIKITTKSIYGNFSKTYNLKFIRSKTRSKDASLRNLGVLTNGAVMTPQFSPDSLSYTVSGFGACEDNLIWEISPNAPHATYRVDKFTSIGWGQNTTKIASGDNVIRITVLAEDTTSKRIYKFNINRPVSPQASSKLSYLNFISDDKILPLTPQFSPNTLLCSLYVHPDIRAINIDGRMATACDKVKLNGDFNQTDSSRVRSLVWLNPGRNLLIVTGIAENGIDSTQYRIIVTRGNVVDANLSSLAVFNQTLSPAFDPEVISYSVSVSEDVSEVYVNAVPLIENVIMIINGSRAYANISSDAIPVGFGETVIPIDIASPGELSKKSYKIIVTKPFVANVGLTNLVMSNSTLSPAFASSTSFYTASVPNDISSISITPTASATNTLIKVNNEIVSSGSTSSPIPLQIGDNAISINSTSSGGGTGFYKITVTRARSSNANLASIVPSNGTLSPAFSSSTTSYSMAIPYSVSSINVKPIVMDSNATIKIHGVAVRSGFFSESILLSVGSNLIDVVVTAPDGKTMKRYSLNVNRLLSDNANLSSLVVTGGTYSPTFSNATTAYIMSVPNSVASIKVTPTAADVNAKVKINTNPAVSGRVSSDLALTVGSNQFSIVVTAPNGTTVKTYTLTVIRGSSVNAKLSALTLSSGTLSPSFAEGTTAYTATVANSVTSITITPTVAESTTKVKVQGNAVASGSISSPVNLSIGTNLITIVTTAQDTSVHTTYSIIVTRKKSTNADLSGLELSTGTLTPVFSPDSLLYRAVVENATTTCAITPVVQESTTTFRINGNAADSGKSYATVNLNIGDNTYIIKTSAQDTTFHKTYTIIIKRLKSPDADLKTLTVSNGTLFPSFTKTVQNYYDTVAYSQTSLTITAANSDPEAKIAVNGTSIISGQASQPLPLNVGVNLINVNVTAPDTNKTKTYTISVYRTGPSTNANLAGVVFSVGTPAPAFVSGVYNYTVSVPNLQTSVTVTPSTESSASSIKVNGVTVTSGLASGSIPLTIGNNIVTISVLAQDGQTSRTYTFDVQRAKSTDANLSQLAISVGALSPTFSSTVTAYSVPVSFQTRSITVTPTRSEPNAVITVQGSMVNSGQTSSPVSLNVGTNVILVNVTAQDTSAKKSYAITVTRSVASTDASLSSIALSSGTLSPTFNKSTLAYTATIPFANSSITVTPSLSHQYAFVKVNGVSVQNNQASNAISLNVGSNTVTLDVLAEDSSTSTTYSINAVRAGSPEADLLSLALSAGTLSPSFSASTTSYTASVANTVSSVTITPTVKESHATISVQGNLITSGQSSEPILLNVGANPIQIVSRAQDGTTTKTYTIIITRAPSSVATLADLVISGVSITPSFSSGTFQYTATIPNSPGIINVTPTTSASTVTVTVNGSTVLSGQTSNSITVPVGSSTVPVVCTAQDGLTTNTYTIAVTRLPSSNADLSGIVLSSGTLSPAFSSVQLSYSASVANAESTITVTPIVAEASASVKVNGVTVASNSASGSISLAVGSNPVTIVTTAQDGITSKTSTIVITRAPSSNANLSSLTASSGVIMPSFDNATTSYTLSVANAVTSVTLTPIIAEPTASVKINNVTIPSGQASGSIALAVGSTVATVVTTAQDGTTTKTFTINITRAPSSNAILSTLSMSSGSFSPAFSSSVYTYTGSVTGSTSSITMTPTVADPTATIQINGNAVTNSQASGTINLSTGDNVLTVLVTAQDGTTTNTYSFTINRPISLSNNANLSGLIVKDNNATQKSISPSFNANTITYSVMGLYNVNTSITITPTVAYSAATVTVNGIAVVSGQPSGAINLNVGSNSIPIVVTAEDGTTKTYTVNATRSAVSSDANLYSLNLNAGNGLSPTFVNTTTSYATTAENNIASIKVTAATHAYATMTINGTAVANGVQSQSIALNNPVSNPYTAISIVVTAENGTTTKTYTINVFRLLAQTGYYQFTGNWADSSSNANNLVNTGATLTSDRSNTANRACLFTAASSQYCTTPLTSGFSSAFSIAFWIKPGTVSSDAPIISKNGISPETNNTANYFSEFLAEYTTAGKIRITVGSTVSGKENVLTSTATLTVGTWYHVAFDVESTSKIKLYINGADDSYSNAPVGLVRRTSTSLPVQIGRYYSNGSARYFNGTLDQVRFFYPDNMGLLNANRLYSYGL